MDTFGELDNRNITIKHARQIFKSTMATKRIKTKDN